jgi:uncharacterized membrane protein
MSAKAMSKEPQRHKTIFVVGLFFFGLTVIGFVLQLYQKIRTGHGVESYVSGTQIELTYIAAAISLAMVAIVPVAFFIRFLIETWEKREIAAEERQRKKRPNKAL